MLSSKEWDLSFCRRPRDEMVMDHEALAHVATSAASRPWHRRCDLACLDRRAAGADRPTGARGRRAHHARRGTTDCPSVARLWHRAGGAKLAGGTVTAFDVAIHDKATRADDLPLIVDYWAPWCGPCRTMAPEFAKAATALRGQARFAKIDTEQFPAVSQRLHIKGIPLLVLYARGREIARLPGARPAAQIEAFVREHL